MRLIKYRCNKCGHVEEPTTRDFITESIKQILYAFGIVAIVAIIFIYFVIGIYTFLDTIQSAFIFSKAGTKEINTGLRTMGLDITKDCDRDQICEMSELNKWVFNNIRFVLTPGKGRYKLSMEYTLKTMSGDCKQMSSLLSSMLFNIGIDSNVICLNKEDHCFVVAMDGEGNPFYLEPTNGNMRRLNENPWKMEI